MVLDFESIYTALKEKEEEKIFSENLSELYTLSTLLMAKVRESIWDAEITLGYEENRTAKEDINKCYSFVVDSCGIEDNCRTLSDKLREFVKVNNYLSAAA